MKIHGKTISIFLHIHMKIHEKTHLSGTKIHEKSISFREQISQKNENSLKNTYLSGVKFHQNDRFRKWIFDDFHDLTEERCSMLMVNKKGT